LGFWVEGAQGPGFRGWVWGLGGGGWGLGGARPVHLIISMITWIRTSRLSIKNSLSAGRYRIFLVEGKLPGSGHHLRANRAQLKRFKDFNLKANAMIWP